MDAKTCLLVLNNSNNEINDDINERNLTIKKKIKINAFITILHSIISLNIGNITTISLLLLILYYINL